MLMLSPELRLALQRTCCAVCAALCLLLGRPLPGVAEGPAGSPPTAAPSAASGAAATMLLGQFAAAWADVAAYSATVTIFERKDTQVQNVVFSYSFHQPSDVSVHVDAGPNAGVTMAWNGGNTVVAHRGSGFMALLKKTFALHDPQATTIRGSSVDELSFGAILAHARQEPGKLAVTPQADAGVEAVTLLSADPAANAGLTREIVELSTITHLPVEVLGYDGSTLVRQIDFSNVTLTLNDKRDGSIAGK
jgi:outer membrane lipoprotein-sorting protein